MNTNQFQRDFFLGTFDNAEDADMMAEYVQNLGPTPLSRDDARIHARTA